MYFVNKALLENTSLSEYKISKLTEESKTILSDKLVTKLYKSIQKNSKDIDVNDITVSEGDVEKLAFYKDLKGAMKFLKNLADKSDNNDFKELIKDLDYTDQFLIKYKKYFVKAYSKNNMILKNCYVATVGSEVQLISYAISKCLVFENNGVMFETKVRKNTPGLKHHTGYKHLKNLLELARKEKLDKNFKDSLALNEAAVGLTWLGITLLVLTSIRGIIYMFFNARVKLSEYIGMIKDYVDLNQANIKDPQIKAKQQKWVDRLERLSERISIDQDVASARAKEKIEQENNDNGISENDLGLL